MNVRDRIRAHWREVTVGVLAIAAAALLIVMLVFNGSLVSGRGAPALDREDSGRIDSVIEATLARFGIDAASGHVVRLREFEIPPPRKEIRYRVPTSFAPVLFNHELAVRLEPLGVKVVGTEDPQARRIVVHVRKDEYVVRSLVFQESE